MNLEAVTEGYDVIGHGCFLHTTQPDMPVVLLEPALNGMSCLSHSDRPTLAADIVNTWCFHVEVTFNASKETGDLPRRETYSFDVTS
jgi:hypothetical protein